MWLMMFGSVCSCQRIFYVMYFKDNFYVLIRNSVYLFVNIKYCYDRSP